MQNLQEFRGILVQVFLTPYCVRKNVVDIESGEIVLSKLEGDLQAAFENGYNTCPVEVVVSREVSDNGTEYRYIHDLNNEEITYLQGWYSGHKKHKRTRGGKTTLHLVNYKKVNQLHFQKDVQNFFYKSNLF